MKLDKIHTMKLDKIHKQFKDKIKIYNENSEFIDSASLEVDYDKNIIVEVPKEHRKEIGELIRLTKEPIKEGFLIRPNAIEYSSDEEKDLVKVLTKESKEKFNSPDLLFHIHELISQRHLEDNKLKLTVFLVGGSAYLEPAALHQSIALKSNSSAGKDNLFKTILNLFPEGTTLWVTSGTKATLEDDIKDFKIIGFSEVNVGTEQGANVQLRETIKQMTDGGTSSMKKDIRTGFKTTRFEKQPQKSVFYGTTESTDDEELETRFIISGIKGSTKRNKIVNKNSLEWFGGKRIPKQKHTWFNVGVSNFKYSEVVIPYFEKLIPLFDNTEERSKRDVKRFMSLVSATTWMFQHQRQTHDQNQIVSRETYT